MRRLLRLLLVLMAAGSVSAQVFWRRPRNVPGDWSQGYETNVRVQQGRGEFRMFSVDGSMAQIHQDLYRRHGDSLVWMPGDHVAWGMSLQNGWLTRYLVQPNAETEGFWVFELRQRENEAGRPGAKPVQHQLRALPAFPQSDPSFYSLDEGTQMAVEVSTTYAPPDAVLDHLSSALSGQGWQASPLNTGGMRMFVRRDQVAFVSATRGKDGQTRVVRLHKPLGVD